MRGLGWAALAAAAAWWLWPRSTAYEYGQVIGDYRSVDEADKAAKGLGLTAYIVVMQPIPFMSQMLPHFAIQVTSGSAPQVTSGSAPHGPLPAIGLDARHAGVPFASQLQDLERDAISVLLGPLVGKQGQI